MKEAEERKAKLAARAEMMDKKRKELQAQQKAMEAKIGQGYQNEREKLLEEEKEAKRMEMLSRLRAQAKLED